MRNKADTKKKKFGRGEQGIGRVGRALGVKGGEEQGFVGEVGGDFHGIVEEKSHVTCACQRLFHCQNFEQTRHGPFFLCGSYELLSFLATAML